MYSPLHIKKTKNTSAFDLRSSSGVRRGIENDLFFLKKEEKKKIDKKLKQNNFQNLNVNLKERHPNDENLR